MIGALSVLCLVLGMVGESLSLILCAIALMFLDTYMRLP